jgi:hypothetical protein
MASYGEKVKYEIDKKIEFPDFTLTFIDIKQIVSLLKKHPTSTEYVFRIEKGDEWSGVEWGSGTGLIMPIKFEFNGKNFWIELSYAQKFGRLEEDELVISNEYPGEGEK